MPAGHVLEFTDVTKRFRGVDAVAGLTTRVEPGVVTGFLGPNGAGKTTSMRILLGLISPTTGTARIGGVDYADLPHPLQTVGAALEASSFHPGRSAAGHLKVYADAAGIPRRRVDEVLGLVGLSEVAGRKVGGYSLGMRQRLGLATALLGDPGVLVLDEPANGLDPEGIKWMRTLLRAFAAEGRTVLVSSHLLSEIQQTADRILILAKGRLVFEGTLEDLADPSEYATIVDSPDRTGLAAALTAAGVTTEMLRSGLAVRGAEPVEVGAIAAAAGIALSSLQRRGPALEEIFLSLVDGTRVHEPRPAAEASDTPALAPIEADADAPAEDAPTPQESVAEDARVVDLEAAPVDPITQGPGEDPTRTDVIEIEVLDAQAIDAPAEGTTLEDEEQPEQPHPQEHDRDGGDAR